MVLGRLVEAHADAFAILAELDGPPPRVGQRWGVWAAGAPGSVTAQRSNGSLHLEGTRCWCSGARLLSHALVTAELAGEPVLCAVELDRDVRADPGVWRGAGMAAADTCTVRFDGVAAEAVGPPGAYLGRPGFWMGAIGVAACWQGGAARLADSLRRRCAAAADPGPHTLAHLGRTYTLVVAGRALLERAATELDAHPQADHRILALAVRSAIERNATEIMDRVGRALGPGPLAHDADHARRIADLTVYLRQDHAEGDLEALGRDLVRSPASWGPSATTRP